MAEHPNVARIRDGYAAFAKGDFAALNELFADDIVLARRRTESAGEGLPRTR